MPCFANPYDNYYTLAMIVTFSTLKQAWVGGAPSSSLLNIINMTTQVSQLSDSA